MTFFVFSDIISLEFYIRFNFQMNEILINNNIQAEDLESKLKETTSLTEQQIQEIVPVILNTLSEIKEMENKKAEDTIARIKKQAFREVGVAHYLDYQFRRNKRRAARIINRLFNTHFHV